MVRLHLHRIAMNVLWMTQVSVEQRSKHPGHATMLREAADLVGLPNALYSLTTETTGPNDGCQKSGPIELTINKQLGYDQCGVLIPNSYFGGNKGNKGNLTAWAKENKESRRDAVPFDQRRPVAPREIA